MKKASSILCLLLLGAMLPVFMCVQVQSENGWGEPNQLTFNTQNDWYPCITDDGTKIAFQSWDGNDYEIFVINSDGTGLDQLTDNIVDDTNLCISGDGTKIAFESEVDGDSEIFVVNYDGSGLTQLTEIGGSSPSIRADGAKIVFCSRFDGDSDIYMVNSDGTNLIKLTDNTDNDARPCISGDGTKIVYSKNYFGGINEALCIMNSDGTGSIELSAITEKYSISVSNDGTKIAYGRLYITQYDIFVINSDASGKIQLTTDRISYDPCISADGSKITFFSYVDGDGEIFVVNSDGTGLTQLTHNTAGDLRPSVCGDGSKIAFQSDVDGDWEIFLVSSLGLDWSVDLFASVDEYHDLSTLCVATDASDGFDVGYDYVDPPAPPIGLVSYFYYPDNPSQLQKLSTSIISSAPTLTWDYRVVPVGVSGSITIDWSSEEVATIPSEKGVYLICPDDLIVDMRSTTSYSFSAEADSTYLFEVMVGGVDVVLDLDAGWNMVSFSALLDNPSFSSIFSDVGFYQVLTWDGTSYVTPTHAEAGVGYWVLVLEETTISIENAAPVIIYTKVLPAGWSMIGSIYGETVDADDVFPGVYQLLTWDGTSYVPSTTIEPGKGYWVLVLEPTTITVS